MIEPPGNEPAEIFPISDTVFAPMGHDAELTFVCNIEGQATEIKLSMGRRKVTAKRKQRATLFDLPFLNSSGAVP